MEPQVSLLCSQRLTILSCPMSLQSMLSHPISFWLIIIIIIIIIKPYF
jgi:hypothetical protein